MWGQGRGGEGRYRVSALWAHQASSFLLTSPPPPNLAFVHHLSSCSALLAFGHGLDKDATALSLLTFVSLSLIFCSSDLHLTEEE